MDQLLAAARFFPEMAPHIKAHREVFVFAEPERGIAGYRCVELEMANGTKALVSVCYQIAHLEAVQVPNVGKGFALHVSGLSHHKKWGRIAKGLAVGWADRKGWKNTECEAALVAMATTPFGVHAVGTVHTHHLSVARLPVGTVIEDRQGQQWIHVDDAIYPWHPYGWERPKGFTVGLDYIYTGTVVAAAA